MKTEATNYTLIVNETMTFDGSSSRLDKVKGSIIQFSLSTETDGFYSLKHSGKSIDFPKNWGVFKGLEESHVVDVFAEDQLLNNVLCDFFGIQGNFRLVKSSVGAYLVFTEQKKGDLKAA